LKTSAMIPCSFQFHHLDVRPKGRSVHGRKRALFGKACRRLAHDVLVDHRDFFGVNIYIMARRPWAIPLARVTNPVCIGVLYGQRP